MKTVQRSLLVLGLTAVLCGCSDTDENGTKAICNSDAVASTRSTVDETNCVSINLSSPESTHSDVTVREEDGELIIKVKSAEGMCLSLSGSRDGGVRIKNSNNVDIDLILNSITITSDSRPGYLKLNSGNDLWGNTYLVKLVGTSSITGASGEDSKKVLSAESNLSFTGDGELNITAKYKTGIGCDDVITVYGGSLNITLDRSEAAKVSGYSEKGFGIKAVNGFVMEGGTVRITANDGVTGYESRGIKVDGSDETACHTAKGYIHINGGDLIVSSDAKALTAGWEAEEDATTRDTADDPFPDVVIAGGKLTLTTTGTPRENSSNSLSPEGIEGKRNIEIRGGQIVVNATDDGIQAGNNLVIGGGLIYARSSQNDAIDSNQSIFIMGGTTLALGASEPEGGLDADNNNNVTTTGGILVAIGGDNNAPQGTAETGATVSYGSFVQTSLGTGTSSGGMGGPGGMGGMGGSSELAGVTIALTADGSDEVIVAAKVPADYVGGTNVLILADPITSGDSYILYTSAEISPSTATWFEEVLLMESATVSGGTANAVTAGTATGGMGGGPGGMGGNPGGGPGGEPPVNPGQ